MDRQRVQVVRERFLVAELRLQLFRPVAVRRSTSDSRLCDDAVLGGGDEVRVADRHPDQHAHREREQDGGERERVVAVVEHARREIERGGARESSRARRRREACQPAPNSSWSFSHSRSTTSRSAGVIQTTAIIAIRPAAITTSSGVNPGRG